MINTSEAQSLTTIAQDMGMKRPVLISLIELHPQLKEAIKPYQHENDNRKNKRLMPPKIVKLIYEVLG